MHETKETDLKKKKKNTSAVCWQWLTGVFGLVPISLFPK